MDNLFHDGQLAVQKITNETGICQNSLEKETKQIYHSTYQHHHVCCNVWMLLPPTTV